MHIEMLDNDFAQFYKSFKICSEHNDYMNAVLQQCIPGQTVSEFRNKPLLWWVVRFWRQLEMSGLLQASATSRAVRWEALSVLGSAPRSNRICAVLRFPPAALNIKGVMPDNKQEGYIATLVQHQYCTGCHKYILRYTCTII